MVFIKVIINLLSANLTVFPVASIIVNLQNANLTVFPMASNLWMKGQKTTVTAIHLLCSDIHSSMKNCNKRVVPRRLPQFQNVLCLVFTYIFIVSCYNCRTKDVFVFLYMYAVFLNGSDRS